MILDSLRKLLSFLDRPTHWRLAGLMLLMLLATLMEMAGLGLLIPFLQLVVDQDRFATMPLGGLLLDLTGGDSQQLLLSICGILIVFFILKNVYLLWVLWLQHNFVLSRMVVVSENLLARVLNQSYANLVHRNTAELIRNVRQLVSISFNKGLRPFLQLLLEGTTMLGLLVVLALVEPLATAAVVGALGLVMVGHSLMMARRERAWGDQSVLHEGQIQLWLQQALGAIKDVRLSGRATYFINAYGRSSRARAKVDVRSQTAPHIPRLLLETIAAVSMVALVMLFIIQGRHPSEAIPTLGVFGLAAVRVAPSLSRLIGNVALLRESRKSIELVYEDFHSLPAVGAGMVVRPLEIRTGIDVHGLSYTYPQAAAKALDDVGLSIGRGESVALVGRSGAGKTTFVDVLLGLLTPQAGSISVDGTDIRTCMAAWQRSIGYVPQTIYLIDDTLRRNIALGVSDAEIDEARIRSACQLAQLEPVLQGLPQGLDTVIGERGARLSGGQRQRIGLARALYDDPRLLVLDEATSALDSETEQEITRAIDSLARVKTVIVIAHRLSTVQHCDKIVLMDQGRIADIGTFAQLNAANPIFRRMVEQSRLDGAEVAS